MTYRKTLCMSVAALALLSTPVQAATFLFGGTGAIIENSWVENAQGTTQIQLDNGAVLSFVGKAKFKIDLDEVIVSEGAVTILTTSGQKVSLRLPDGRIVTVSGSASLDVSSTGVRSHVITGQSRVSGSGQTQTFSAGAFWAMAKGQKPKRVFANAAQNVTPAIASLKVGGIQAAAKNGLPIALGNALAALGVGGDILSAGKAVDARVSGDGVRALPSGNFETLLAFSNRLAASIGDGQLFAGSNPALIETYLRYLAGNGNIAEFQSAYLAIITQYLSLLNTGGNVADFQALGISDVNVYLNYLNSVGGVSQLTEMQRALVTEYLAFLSEGGLPVDFLFSQAQLSDDVIAQFGGVISTYLTFLSNGGTITEFQGASIDVITRYINLLEVNGVLDVLFGAQANILRDYLAFINAGGSVVDFTGFADLPIGMKLAQQYVDAISVFIAFVSDGGTPSEFTGFTADVFVEYIQALTDAGFLSSLLANQQDFLSEYLAFLNDGGNFDTFSGLPLSDALAQQYADSINAFISFVSEGGLPSEFAEFNAEVFVEYIQALTNAGLLASLLEEQQDFLVDYLAFLNNGGNFDEFSGLPLSDVLAQQYAESINAFITFVNDGGVPSEFTGLTPELFTQYLQALLDAGLLQSLFMDQLTFLTDYLSFLNGGGDIDDFVGLPTVVDATTQIAIVDAFLVFIKAGGLPSEFTEASLSTLRRYFEDNASIALQRADRLVDNGFLNTFFRQTEFSEGTEDDYAGLPANGGSTVDNRLAYALNRPDSTSSERGSALSGTFITTLDSNGAPVGILGNILARDAEVIERDIGEQTSSTRISAGRVTSGGQNFVLMEDQGVHYAFAPSLSNTPTNATVNYIVETATSPTFNDGASAPGTFDGQIAINYDGQAVRVATEGSVDMPTDTIYNFTTEGGLAGVESLQPSSFDNAPNRPLLALSQNAELSGTGRACVEGATACRLGFTIMPGGDGASSLAVSYTSFDGGEGSVGFAGAAGFVAQSDDDNTSTADVENIRMELIHTLSNGTTQSTRSLLGDANTSDEGAVLTLSDPTDAESINFDSEPLIVNTTRRDGDVILSRYDGPNYIINNQDVAIGAGFLDTAAIVNPATVLPTNGMVSYQLTDTLGIQTTDDFQGETVIEAIMAVSFGAESRIALEGFLSLDNVYTFSTDGGLADVVENGENLLSPFVFLRTDLIGTGNYCAADANCLFTLRGNFSEGFGQFGSVFQTTGGEERAFGAASFTETDNPTLSMDIVIGGDTDDGNRGVLAGEGTSIANQNTVYTSNFIGIDSRPDITVTYDNATGAPIAYDTNIDMEFPNIGTATLNESGSVTDVIGWTRWADGLTDGRYFALQDGITLPERSGWHVVSGTPATNLPTEGKVDYDLIGSTAPTIRDGSLNPGSLEGRAAIAFGSAPKVGVELDVTIGGSTYGIATAGGVADPSQGILVETSGDVNMTFSDLNLTATGNGPVCSGNGTCGADIRGFLAGEGASHVGLVYTFGNTGFDTQVNGSAVFASR